MKKYMYLLIILLLLCCFSCLKRNNVSQSNHILTERNTIINDDTIQVDILKIDICYEDINNLHVIHINCDEFENTCNDQYENLSIINKRTLSKFEKEFNSLQIAQSSTPKPDARIHINVYRQGIIESYCIGMFSVMKEGVIYEFSDSLWKLLEDINVIPIINGSNVSNEQIL